MRCPPSCRQRGRAGLLPPLSRAPRRAIGIGRCSWCHDWPCHPRLGQPRLRQPIRSRVLARNVEALVATLRAARRWLCHPWPSLRLVPCRATICSLPPAWLGRHYRRSWSSSAAARCQLRAVGQCRQRGGSVTARGVGTTGRGWGAVALQLAGFALIVLLMRLDWRRLLNGRLPAHLSKRVISTIRSWVMPRMITPEPKVARSSTRNQLIVSSDQRLRGYPKGWARNYPRCWGALRRDLYAEHRKGVHDDAAHSRPTRWFETRRASAPLRAETRCARMPAHSA